MKLYVLYDRVTSVYSEALSAPNDEYAKFVFGGMSDDLSKSYDLPSSDFDIYFLAEYDLYSGTVSSSGKCEFVCRLTDAADYYHLSKEVVDIESIQT